MNLRLVGALGLIGMLQGCALGHAALVTVFASPGPKLCEVRLINEVKPVADGKLEVTVSGAGIPGEAMRLRLLSQELTRGPYARKGVTPDEIKARRGAFDWVLLDEIPSKGDRQGAHYYKGTWGASYAGEQPCSFKDPLVFKISMGTQPIEATAKLDALLARHEEAYGEFKLHLHPDKLVVGWSENKGKTAITLHATPKYWALEPEETAATIPLK